MPHIYVNTNFGALWGKAEHKGWLLFHFLLFFSFVCIYVYLYIVAYSYCLNLPTDLLQYWFLSKRKFGNSCLTWWRLLGSEPSLDLLGFNAWMLKLDINQWFSELYLFLLFLKDNGTRTHLLMCVYVCLKILVIIISDNMLK